MYPDRWRRRLLTAEGLLDLNMPRASTEASDKFSAKYGQSVGVVIFDDVFVPHDRASRRVELQYDTATESTIGGLLTNQIFHCPGDGLDGPALPLSTL
jgi:aromatic ring hydroxylase